MKKLAVLSILIALTVMFVFSTIDEILAQGSDRSSAETTLSCNSTACQQMTDEILRSTVRIHLQAWRIKEDESGYFLDESTGHATLKDGRTLVTHNHYALLDEQELPVSIAFYAADGRYLFSAPLQDFDVTLAGAETQHFTMKYDYLAQRLAAAGITSANYGQGHDLDLQPGMSVAQIDWDGTSTRVDWTTIAEVNIGDGVPRLVLGNGVTQGGSGGGVFWNGLHIANNWQSIAHFDHQGQMLYETSVVALDA